ncbi:ribonuclease Z [Ignicoccus pacificus DSM 13166]|uniref:Ribonuclease Z n=1 Tax=Ignicoccus pacificus DSM 13166 TaxID=940294 RepID=A0A977K960_9CREN|nr:ribonuclease Z [Ignicoccus pacificus DSM 13166]
MKALFYVLGTSAATPKPKRALPSYYFEHEGIGILMDCGEGTQFQVMKAGIGFSKIKVIAISHNHGDHLLGLPGLIETMSMGSRKEDLLIIGPPGIKEFLEVSFKVTTFAPSFKVYVLEITEEVEVPLRGIKLKMFPVKHHGYSFGIRVETVPKRKVNKEKLEELGVPKRLWGRLQQGEEVEWKGRVLKPEEFTWQPQGIKVVYSGDTAPCERVIEEARGADLLVHEATFLSDMEEEAHERGHSTAKDAGIIASEAKVKMLLLTHYSSRYEDLRRHLDEARRFFEYAYLAQDLMKVVIKK